MKSRGQGDKLAAAFVALRGRAWIEIAAASILFMCAWVALRGRAWIEMNVADDIARQLDGRPPREGVD